MRLYFRQHQGATGTKSTYLGTQRNRHYWLVNDDVCLVSERLNCSSKESPAITAARDGHLEETTTGFEHACVAGSHSIGEGQSILARHDKTCER